MSLSARSIFWSLLLSLMLGGLAGFGNAAAAELPVIDEAAWAQNAQIMLPASRTTLHVKAHSLDPSLNPLTYRWVQVGGPPAGRVSFSPNDDPSSDTTTATFNRGGAGTYTFRVIVSDGFSESISDVEVLVQSRRSGPHPTGSKFRPEQRGERTFYTRIDRVIVGFETAEDRRVGPARFSQASQAVLESLGATLTKTWMQGRLGLVECVGEMHDRVALDKFLSALEALPEIRFAEPDDSIQLDYLPNDPRFAEQYALQNPTGVDIGATLAWDQTTGSGNTLVAVMDSGIDYTHPDIYLAIAINAGEIPASLLSQIVDTNSNGRVDFYDLNSLDSNGSVVLDGGGILFNQALTSDTNLNGYIDAEDLRVPAWMDGVDGDSNGYLDDLTGWDSLNSNNDPMDLYGHGTHVTGILAARGDNGIGITGVNWHTQILPERFWNANGGSSAGAIAAIDHAVLLGADVINASWGTFTNSIALRAAIEFAGASDVVVVVAAGNQSSDIDNPLNAYYPAAYTGLTNLISVASVDPAGTLSSFSNYGLTTVDIGAPGASVLSTKLGGGYDLWSGTSFSAPHVTGVVSLLAGLFPNQTAAGLVARVLATAAPLSSLAGKTVTGGMVDAFAAVNTLSTAGPRVVMANPIGDVAAPVSKVVLTFDSTLNATTFSVADVVIAGPSGPIVPTSVNALAGSVFEVVFPSQTQAGLFSLTVGPDIEDGLARLMDQDRDGTAGEALDDQFTVAFNVLPPPTSLTIDNGDAGYSATAGWTTYVGAGAAGDLDFATAGSGLETATWTLGGLVPGDYRVSVTWEAFTNRAIDAPYTVWDGSTPLASVTVNQTLAPADFMDGGVTWHDLGIYSLIGDTLVVELSDLAGPAGSVVIADAVRVEGIGGLLLAPEVQVLIGGANVADGTGSFDFGATTVGIPVSQAISVANVGALDLALGSITLPSGYSLVSGFGSTLLAPGQATSFVVQLDAATQGTPIGVIRFDSNDANENPFDFSVSGTVSPALPPGPEIEVRLGAAVLVDGTGSVDFGTSQMGTPVTQAITVENLGTTDLTLGAISLPADFSLFAGFGSTLLAPGQTTNFVLQLDAVTVGSHLGSVSFVSNDANENPFDFMVSGTVTPAPFPTWTIDDGDVGYSATAGWTPFTGAGAQGDFDFIAVGSGTETASWTQAGLATGQYRVSVTWEAFSNRTQDAPYTVFDGAAAIGTLNVDQRIAPVGSLVNGVMWQEIGVFPLNGGTLTVELKDLAGPPGSFVIADGVRLERIGDLPSGPEISVSAAGVAIADGTGSVDFGTTVIGAPLNQTITVANLGTTDLTLGAITLPADFSLVSGFGTTLLVPGQTTDFVVQMDALIVGTPTGVVSFVSNDANENPFDMMVSGIVALELFPTFVIDDSDPGYSATAGWASFTGSGAQGTFSYTFAMVGSGTETATWTQGGLTAGQYRVSVTWDEFTNRAVDSAYSVLDGVTPLGTVAVDQTAAPVGFVENGVVWQDLGIYPITGGTLAVELGNLATPSGSLVIADAVRLERVAGLSAGPEISVQVDAAAILDGTGSVDFGTTGVGMPLTRTVTVTNLGTADLSLGAITMPADFSLVSGFGATLLVTGQSTNFVVQMDALVEGTPTGVVSFVSNDANENPFDFSVSGTVGPVMLPTFVIDDGDAGYSVTGVWSTFSGSGAQGDFDYIAVGTGSEKALWTQSGLTAGDYRVSVTWEAYTNRAVDSAYSVSDGATPLGTVAVDQTAAPVGFVENGVVWQDLGIYPMTGGTLAVELSNLATPPGSLVIADAVRLERVGGLPIGPEISVQVAAVSIADGTGSLDFGTTMVGAPVAKTLTVTNLGDADLSLGAITLPAGYSLFAGFGSTLLAPGQTTDFVVQMDALSVGTPTGVMSFVSNDANENPFDINLSGVVSPKTLWVIDDGDLGYAATAGWAVFTGSGAQGDYDFIAVGTGSETAFWTQTGLTAGQYRVSVTWDAFNTRPVDAPYTVLDGATELATVIVDQSAIPASFTEAGVLWQDLGVYTVTGNTLAVRLSDLASPPGSLMVADAVRFENIGAPPTGPEIRVTAAGVVVPDGTGLLDFGTTGLGVPVMQTITVANVGTADLSLGAIALPAQYSLFAGFGSTLLASGQTTDFIVQYDAVSQGTQAGVMSFGSNDANANPYDITVVPEPGVIAQLVAGTCALLALRRRGPRMA